MFFRTYLYNNNNVTLRTNTYTHEYCCLHYYTSECTKQLREAYPQLELLADEDEEECDGYKCRDSDGTKYPYIGKTPYDYCQACNNRRYGDSRGCDYCELPDDECECYDCRCGVRKTWSGDCCEC